MGGYKHWFCGDFYGYPPRVFRGNSITFHIPGFQLFNLPFSRKLFSTLALLQFYYVSTI